jgi:hypothetical protein
MMLMSLLETLQGKKQEHYAPIQRYELALRIVSNTLVWYLYSSSGGSDCCGCSCSEGPL